MPVGLPAADVETPVTPIEEASIEKPHQRLLPGVASVVTLMVATFARWPAAVSIRAVKERR